MPLMRSEKDRLIEHYQQSMAAAPHAFLVDYKGITVNQDVDLRARIREVGGSYEVVKNRLALRAIDGKALAQLKDQFVGPTAVAYADDPVALAKVLTGFAKEVPKLELKGGVVEGATIAAEQIKDIAMLPSREELIAKLLFLLQSPITRFVRGLAAIPQQLVVVLDQIAKQREAAGGQ
ncbi:MAG: 50S ribosomal protein L10 [Acidobacteria bacterium]|nr:MAG: 50S ribosomal protein L10 [Acidobacteriota bacterium]